VILCNQSSAAGGSYSSAAASGTGKKREEGKPRNVRHPLRELRGQGPRKKSDAIPWGTVSGKEKKKTPVSLLDEKSFHVLGKDQGGKTKRRKGPYVQKPWGKDVCS